MFTFGLIYCHWCSWTKDTYEVYLDDRFYETLSLKLQSWN